MLSVCVYRHVICRFANDLFQDVILVMCNNPLSGNLLCCQLYIDFCCNGKVSVVLAMICCRTKAK